MREPLALDAYWDEVGLGPAPIPGSTTRATALQKDLTDLDEVESRARRLVERLALVFQASLLVRHSTRRDRRRVLRVAPR